MHDKNRNETPHTCSGAAHSKTALQSGFFRQLGLALRNPQTLGALVIGIVVAVGLLGLRSIPFAAQLADRSAAALSEAKKTAPSPTTAASQAQVPLGCC